MDQEPSDFYLMTIFIKNSWALPERTAFPKRENKLTQVSCVQSSGSLLKMSEKGYALLLQI